MIFDKEILKEKILKKLSILDEKSESKIIIQNPQNVIIKNDDSSSGEPDQYEDEEITQNVKPTDTSAGNSEVPAYEDEAEVLDLASDPSVDDDKLVDIPPPIPDPEENISYEDEGVDDEAEVLDLASDPSVNDDKIVDIPAYEDEGPSAPVEPSEQDVNAMASDPTVNDDETTQIASMMPATSMLNPNVSSYEDEDAAVNSAAASPEVQQPVGTDPYYNDEEQIDPNTGMPVQQAGMPPAGGAVDPTTGMPIQQPGAIDPVTGLPAQTGAIDPTTGMPLDPNSDEMNPEMTIGNSSEVVKGAPVPLEDLSRIEELKNINSQLMQIRQILEKELNNKYNKVEDKVIEAVNYFRSIISNLDSFSTQIDDIIFKYKRFILAVLTEINNIKELEAEEANGSDKSKDKKDSKTKSKKSDKDKQDLESNKKK